ncbi:MAG: DUF5069 domain-containing protein [Blastochloris sp.]|mgnify:CR=1 FL=1|nr:DUF5069 domain-containing protein [Blastochloris sp.]
MKPYEWTKQFKTIYDKSLSLYHKGQRGADTFFNKEEITFLESLGCTAQELYDFAEDADSYGDPDYSTALLVASVRRDYFLTIQKGIKSATVTAADELPAKTDKLEGIEWLPRIMAKARLKLRGEMASEIMYGCGGDRRFLSEHQIHPADFLRHVWAAGEHDSKIIDYVKDSQSKN